MLTTTRGVFGLQEPGIVFTRPEPSVGPSNRFGQGLESPPRAMLVASRIVLTVNHCYLWPLSLRVLVLFLCSAIIALKASIPSQLRSVTPAFRWFLLISQTIDDTSKQLCVYLILMMNNMSLYRLYLIDHDTLCSQQLQPSLRQGSYGQ